MATTGKFRSKNKTQKKLSGDHDIKDCPHELNKRYIHEKNRNALQDKEVITSRDGKSTRVLIVPSRKPGKDNFGIWPESEYQKLKKQANVVSMKDRMALIEEAEQKKIQLKVESEERKEKLYKSFVRQEAVRGSSLDAADSEAKSKNEGLLRRSYELIIEQDDRVREANRLILAKKCHFIRSAQIEEKQLIKRELQEEEKRLDLMMEQYRQRGNLKEQEKVIASEKQRQQVLEEVKNQLKEIEINKIVEAEKREEEARVLNKLIATIQKAENEEREKQQQAKVELRQEFAQTYNEVVRYKKIQEEEQKLADMRISIFLKEKQEREEAREKELAKLKMEKELEQTRMGAAQKKEADKQANIDELNALKSMEDKEREWREKELKAAIKQKQLNDELKRSREKQIDEIRKVHAIALEKEERDFIKNTQIQRELLEKEKQEKKEKQAQTHKFHKELLVQINEKERMKIKDLQDTFEEGRQQRMEYELKARQVDEYLKYKIEKLKETTIPEAYVRDIERQLKIKPK